MTTWKIDDRIVANIAADSSQPARASPFIAPDDGVVQEGEHPAFSFSTLALKVSAKSAAAPTPIVGYTSADPGDRRAASIRALRIRRLHQ